jgi:hypothetical protein
MSEEKWQLVCTTENCELKNVTYEVESNEAECGGCNKVYTKPE